MLSIFFCFAILAFHSCDEEVSPTRACVVFSNDNPGLLIHHQKECHRLSYLLVLNKGAMELMAFNLVSNSSNRGPYIRRKKKNGQRDIKIH